MNNVKFKRYIKWKFDLGKDKEQGEVKIRNIHD